MTRWRRMVGVGLITLGLSAPAQAFELCYRTNFLDVLHLAIDVVAPNIFAVNGIWRGPPVYQLLLGGTGTVRFPADPTAPEVWDIGMAGGQSSVAFGGNVTCSVHMRLTETVQSGVYRIQCPGTGLFTGSGLLTQISCSPVAIAASILAQEARGVGLAGAPEANETP